MSAIRTYIRGPWCNPCASPKPAAEPAPKAKPARPAPPATPILRTAPVQSAGLHANAGITERMRQYLLDNGSATSAELSQIFDVPVCRVSALLASGCKRGAIEVHRRIGEHQIYSICADAPNTEHLRMIRVLRAAGYLVIKKEL